MIDVLLFAKAPRPGYVKTRLAREVGPERAAAIYRDLGNRVLRQIAPVSALTVWYDPPDALSDMRAWLGPRAFRAQPAGDLGDRMAFGFDEHFRLRPGRPAVAIGADAPEVDAGTIRRAADALDARDVVLGPAADGGYYLIGLARPRRAVFRGIPWGTGRVFEATRAACGAAGIEPAVLPTLRDVDTAEDARAMGVLSA